MENVGLIRFSKSEFQLYKFLYIFEFLKTYFQEKKCSWSILNLYFECFTHTYLSAYLNVLRHGLRCPDAFVFTMIFPVEFTLNCLNCSVPGWWWLVVGGGWWLLVVVGGSWWWYIVGGGGGRDIRFSNSDVPVSYFSAY